MQEELLGFQKEATIFKVRNLSKQVAISQYKKREELGFPILARRGGINA